MWQITRDNAVEKLESAKLLLSHGYYTNSYEAGFFAIEIAFKAWMAKNDPSLLDLDRRAARGHPWFSHDLNAILDGCADLRRSLAAGCLEEYLLLRQVSGDSGRWQPWKRYRHRANRELAEGYVNLAEVLQKWMLQNLLE